MDQKTASARTLLVTGGAGFIGTNFTYYWLERYPQDKIINLDALTYAGNQANLQALESNARYRFVYGNITDKKLVDGLMAEVQLVVHFAAESHVDRSIKNPELFLETNLMGTQVLLESALRHHLPHFHHISTDEVFGSLELDSHDKFNETTRYDPRSPYAASKAAADHLVRAYGQTYGLPYTLTNCSNNYGPYMFPEKFIPLAITNIMDGLPVPIYGQGKNVRDWLYVLDHCRGIDEVINRGRLGETYLIGGLQSDISNLEVVKTILDLMHQSESLIEFVPDRLGHDQKYAVDWQKMQTSFDWQPSVSFTQGLEKTIAWYQAHQAWWRPLKDRAKGFFEANYGRHQAKS